MRSVQQEIDYLLNQHLSLQKSLKIGIVNLRSLAKYLIDEYNLKHTLDAVISAIRRYDLENISLVSSIEAEKYFSKMSITTKDNVAKIILRDRAFRDICADFLGKKVLKENCRILKSKETVTLIISQTDLEKKLSLFKESDLIETQTDLSEIRLQFPKDISKVKGAVSRIASELALRDINIEEIFFSIPDLLIYVKENNSVQAHQALREIKR